MKKKQPEIVIYLLQKQLYLKVQDSEHPLCTTGKLKWTTATHPTATDFIGLHLGETC